jgi:hypothetical protein
MKGWMLLQMEFPFGRSMPYRDATIDVYKDMKQYLKSWSEEMIGKIHPGKNISDLFKTTREAAQLVKGEVRVRIDHL